MRRVYKKGARILAAMSMLRQIALAAALALAALAALLASPPAALAIDQPYAYPLTVGTSSVQVLSADPRRTKLVFVNPNATALVAVCPITSRVDSTAITCAVNGAGSITLLPYQSFTVTGVGQNGTIPSAWNAIADTASSHLTVLESE